MAPHTRHQGLPAWMRGVEARLRGVEFAERRRRPRAVISRAVAVNQPQAQTSITWDTSTHQTPLETALWAAGNPTVIQLPIAGWWRVMARAGFAANATGIRQLLISDNALGELDRDIHLNPTAASNAMLRCLCDIYSNGTNFLVVQTIQSSGGNLALAVGRRFCRVEIEYLSP